MDAGQIILCLFRPTRPFGVYETRRLPWCVQGKQADGDAEVERCHRRCSYPRGRHDAGRSAASETEP